MTREDPRREPIALIKAHAYGNDFLIVQEAALRDGESAFAQRVCDRHRGVGADGLMVVGDAPEGGRMRLINADGSPSEISGNGLRCYAAWLAIRTGLKVGEATGIWTDAGLKRLQLIDRPRRPGNDQRLTFVTEMGPPTELREADLDVEGTVVRVVVLRVGNPQCVVLGPATPERLHRIASKLAVHRTFPEGTNVELAEVVNPGEVRILIWERGVGPTESSGTGSCAAAVAAAAYGGANRKIDVVAPGGTQRVEWDDAGLKLTGWAEVVGEVQWSLG